MPQPFDLHIVIISCSLSETSQSRRAVPALTRAFNAEGAATELIDMRALPPTWVNDRPLNDYPAIYQEAAHSVAKADGVVFLVPVYGYEAGSPAKVMTEILGASLADKPVAFITASGSPRSHLALRGLMTSLMFENSCIVFPDSVQITPDLPAAAKNLIPKRIMGLARNFTRFTRCLQSYSQLKEAEIS